MSNFFKKIDDQYVTENFNGLLVLGDVHGVLPPFEASIKYAAENNLYIVSLGDLVDYGPNSKEVIQLIKKLIADGKASAILGNHERKLQKYFVQHREGNVRVKIKSSLQASIGSFDNEDSINDYFTVYNEMAHVMRFKNVFFTHGALHPGLVEKQEYSPMGFQFALFGEVDMEKPMRENGFPNRVFHWVNQIPSDIFVYVGHDIRSDVAPVVEHTSTFMDTGCGKEGVLHGAILENSGSFKEFVNFGA